MMRKVKHEIVAVALAYARCSCGWEVRIEKMRGKSDEDLAIETGEKFVEHQQEQEE